MKINSISPKFGACKNSATRAEAYNIPVCEQEINGAKFIDNGNALFVSTHAKNMKDSDVYHIFKSDGSAITYTSWNAKVIKYDKGTFDDVYESAKKLESKLKNMYFS